MSGVWPSASTESWFRVQVPHRPSSDASLSTNPSQSTALKAPIDGRLDVAYSRRHSRRGFHNLHNCVVGRQTADRPRPDVVILLVDASSRQNFVLTFCLFSVAYYLLASALNSQNQLYRNAIHCMKHSAMRPQNRLTLDTLTCYNTVCSGSLISKWTKKF